MTFYERLTELRRETGVTQKQIQEELNLGKNSFGDWKKGIIPIRSTQQLLAKYFGVSIDYLMGKLITPFLIRKRLAPTFRMRNGVYVQSSV